MVSFACLFPLGQKLLKDKDHVFYLFIWFPNHNTEHSLHAQHVSTPLLTDF